MKPRGVLSDTGIADMGAAGRLPAKEVGKHRWIMVASYVLSAEQAAALYGEQRYGEHLEGPLFFDNANRLGVDGPGCIDCALTYYEAHKRTCPAAGYDYHKEGRGDA